MRLISLRVHGFKSFANPVYLEFAPGLNVVVGPNGSGKSNIIEALRWVLGDSYREMRVSQNRQVIFHGSPAARPLGMAFIETSWEDEGQEVFTLSRRLFSNGESEYFYNERKLKLRDIKEVVYQRGFPGDTMGMNVVDNAKLQTLFDYRPAERFRLFEMLSGMYGMKHKLNILALCIQRLGDKLDRLRERKHELFLQLRRVKHLAAQENEVRVLEEEIQVLRCLFLRRSCADKEHEITKWKNTLEDVEGQKVVTAEEREQKKVLVDKLEEVLQSKEKEKEDIVGEYEIVKENKRKIEQEMFFFMTEARQQVYHGFMAYRIIKRLEQKAGDIRKRLQEIQSHPLFSRISTDYEKEEQMHMGTLGNLRSTLAIQEQERDRTHEQVTRLAAQQEQLSYQRDTLYKEARTLREKITTTADTLRFHREEGKSLTEKKASLRKHIDEGAERLQKRSLLLARMQSRMRQFEKKKRLLPEVQELLGSLEGRQWPGRAIHSLAWLLSEVEVLSRPEQLEMEGRLSSGTSVTAASSLPPSSWWEVTSRERILSCFRKDEIPVKNLISSEGGVAFLRNGFLVFPRKILLESRGNVFFHSLEKRIMLWKERLKSLERDQEKLNGYQEQAERELTRHSMEAERLHERLALLKEENEKCNSKLENIKQSLEKNEKELEMIRRKWDTTSLLCVELKEKARSVEERLRHIQKERLQLVDLSAARDTILLESDTLEREKREAETSLQETDIFHRTSSKRLDLMKDDLLENRLQQSGLQSKLSYIQAILGQHRQRVGDELASLHFLEEKSRNLGEEAGELRLAMEKACFQYDELMSRLNELGDCPRPPTAAEGALKLRDLKERIIDKEAFLRGKTVRRGAIEELEELEERGRFLSQQIDDFQDSVAYIAQLSGACEKEVRNRFRVFVEKVNVLFPQNFQRVFGGGEARVVLEGEGLDVEVQIPGKRRQSLSLLSSGEKALASLCLFLSLFQAGSFRFCFFDEVDANLDHSNSIRFAGLLKEFSQDCQVVIVTHQEEVMESASRILGVTMDSPGISRVISLESLSELRGTLS